MDRSLARGPACLTQALGIGRAHNAQDLLTDGPLRLTPPLLTNPTEDEPPVALSGSDESAQLGVGDVAAGPRVGVSAAAVLPWRFWVTGDETVSTYKRSPRS